VHFAPVDSRLESRGGAPLQGFAIAGEDRKFHWAEASIEGNTVVVSSPDVPKPVGYAMCGVTARAAICLTKMDCQHRHSEPIIGRESPRVNENRLFLDGYDLI